MLKFSEIVGHEQIKDHLQTAVRESKPFHAYIFQGETGVEKRIWQRHLQRHCSARTREKSLVESVFPVINLSRATSRM